MAKTFYSHIAETTEITLLIADMDMPKEDRIKLLRLVEENLHHNLLDLVLGSLSQEDKKTFLTHLAAKNMIRPGNLYHQKLMIWKIK